MNGWHWFLSNFIIIFVVYALNFNLISDISFECEQKISNERIAWGLKNKSENIVEISNFQLCAGYMNIALLWTVIQNKKNKKKQKSKKNKKTKKKPHRRIIPMNWIANKFFI